MFPRGYLISSMTGVSVTELPLMRPLKPGSRGAPRRSPAGAYWPPHPASRPALANAVPAGPRRPATLRQASALILRNTTGVTTLCVTPGAGVTEGTITKTGMRSRRYGGAPAGRVSARAARGTGGRPLPARGRAADRAAGVGRAARPLGAPRARDPAARPVHHRGRGTRPDAGVQPGDAAPGARPAPGLGGRRVGSPGRGQYRAQLRDRPR